MVGTAPDGQLTAASRSARRARFAVAGREHEAALRRLLRETPMRGAISVTFERDPDYFLGAGIGGASDETIGAFEDNRLICMGRCTTRPLWVNGEIRLVGYLAELRLGAEAAGRFDVLRDGYRFFRGRAAVGSTRGERAPDAWFTSIASDNERARQLLERGLRGLPKYRHAGNLTTLLVATGPGWKQIFAPPPHLQLEPASNSELAAFLNETGARHQFAAAWTEARIASLAKHGLPLDAFRVVRGKGAILAAAAVWDQRRFRQTIVSAYSPWLGRARPAINAAHRVLRRPRLPAPGTVLPLGFLSPLAIRPGHEQLLIGIVAAFRMEAVRCGLEHLTLALPADDNRIATLREAFPCRLYSSRLYTVNWPDDAAPTLNGRPVLPEVAFL